jgi:hypothetical protein
MSPFTGGDRVNPLEAMLFFLYNYNLLRQKYSREKCAGSEIL